MVYINQVELKHFKSFGGAMTIPLEPAFTVVTGPNGSGKSNILDGILFCLGLASSRGMRAERLPDLVNSGVLRAGKSSETVVSVRFDLEDWQPDSAEEGIDIPSEGPWIKPGQKEWTVTRRLRVMPGGSYSSSYSADGESCNLQQLQTQFRRLRIDPEGSNVVMQGDVTRIVSMSNKERRTLIDELAGVALFDHRIEQTRLKLDDVLASQERCRIVEQELISSKQRLEKDCQKARLYKELKDQVHIGREQETVLEFEDSQKRLGELDVRKKDLIKKQELDKTSLSSLEKELNESIHTLKVLQDEVKALGEDKLISVQAEIAGLETQSRELDRQAELNKQEGDKLQLQRQNLIIRKQEINEEAKKTKEDKLSNKLEIAEKKYTEKQAELEVTRRRFSDVADRSGELIEEQRERNNSIKSLQEKVMPLQEEKQKLEERLLSNNERLKELDIDSKKDITENNQLHKELNKLDTEWKGILQDIEHSNLFIKENNQLLSVQERTRFRLEKDQTRIEKEIARLESRRETLQESRGAGALRLLLKSGLEGIHGPVAQLGEVDENNRLALEVAAGTRICHVVVDDDQIASKAIDQLKLKKAGRLTFLPLNKIRNSPSKVNPAIQKSSLSNNLVDSNGFIGKAIDLIKYDSIYHGVFSYVFGETLVFRDLTSARTQLGIQRSVTLGGELIEKSGAMTGGSFLGRGNNLSFGTVNESDEIEPLRQRLVELGEALIQSRKEELHLNKLLSEARDSLRKLEQRQASLDAERSTFRKSNHPLLDRQKERLDRILTLKNLKDEHTKRIDFLDDEIKPLANKFKNLQLIDGDLDSKEDIDKWKQFQNDLEEADSSLAIARKERDLLANEKNQRDLALVRMEDNQRSILEEETRLQDLIHSLTKQHKDWRDHKKDLQLQQNKLESEKVKLENLFGEKRRIRDEAEANLSNQRQIFQDSQWKLERLQEELDSLEEELRSSNVRLNQLESNLPDPLPNIPYEIRANGLEALQSELQNLQTRIEALEPVNMLALEELEKLEVRLEELASRLEVLTSERSELLLRVENVATLRQEAFMEAFDAVDGHFREIFASLSDGDGHLQLDNPEDPLEGGLTLVAHPKGKSVRRLAAMSGGEKSLTALSFLFALQRFRPSPFYALDEVDSFLDGVNVERLSGLIARQSEHAQFLVVSHRRPMIGAATKTIGVTQARGAHTQVIGLPIAA